MEEPIRSDKRWEKESEYMQKLNPFIHWGVLGAAVFYIGCWDQTDHLYDENERSVSTDAMPDSDSKTGVEEDSETNTAVVGDKRNSVLDDAWAGFGSACDEESQCAGYPAENKRCLSNVMGLVDSPGGYCTACCDEAGEGVCGQGIDCVGAYNSFLICLERCDTNADCRTEDHYECHAGLYYMETIFPGKYCLPDAEHAVPDDATAQNTTCPWPWSQ